MTSGAPGPGGSRADHLAALLAGADLVAPIEHQRRAAASVDELIDAGRSPVIEAAGGELSVLDLVRTESVLYAARVALWLDLLRAIPGGEAMPDLPVSPELVAADALLRREQPGRAPVVAASTARLRRLRTGAYRTREELRRVRAERGTRPLVSSSTPEVLLVPWRATHVARWHPVLDRLVAEDGWRALVLASDPRAVQAAASSGLGAHRLSWGLGDPRADVSIRRDFARLAAAVGGPLGAALRAVPGPVLAPVRAVAGAVEVLEGARVVVVPNPYVPEGRAAARVAQRMGLPVVSAQHGTIFPDDPRWQRCPVDRFCAWGSAGADALVRSGLAPDQVVVTGVLTGARPVAAPGATGPTGERSGGPHPGTVLVATSGAGDRVSLAQHLVFIDWLANAVAAAPDRQWVVKLHPKDDPALYRRSALSGVRVVPAGPTTPTIDHFLDDAAVVVTVASATALDAARRGVPVVLVAVPGSDDHERVPVLADVADGVAHDGAQLAAEVQRLVTSPPTRHEAQLAAWAEPVADPVAAVCEVMRAVSR